MSTPPTPVRRAVAAAIFGPDDIGKAVKYTFGALQALLPYLISRLFFLGYPERHGINVFNLLFPKNPRCGKLDPPAPYLSSGAGAPVAHD